MDLLEITWDLVRLPDFGHTLLTRLARIDDGNDPIHDQPNQRTNMAESTTNHDKSMFNHAGARVMMIGKGENSNQILVLDVAPPASPLQTMNK